MKFSLQQLLIINLVLKLFVLLINTVLPLENYVFGIVRHVGIADNFRKLFDSELAPSTILLGCPSGEFVGDKEM